MGAKTYSGLSTEEDAREEMAKGPIFLMMRDGVCVGNTSYEIKAPNHAYLAGLVVIPEYQGKGIAREAALFRLRLLQEYKRISLVTHPENLKIQSLYRSLGFEIEGLPVENYFGDGEPRIVMVKE